MTALRRILALLAVLVALGGSAAPAEAPKPEKKPAPRKVLRHEELKVEGRIQ